MECKICGGDFDDENEDMGIYRNTIENFKKTKINNYAICQTCESELLSWINYYREMIEKNKKLLR